MGNVYKVVAGIGMLILVFLLVSNAKETGSIIQTLASNSILGIKTLQGR